MKTLKVSEKDAGKRLDRYLVEKIGLSRGRVKELIDIGRVKIRGKRVVIAKWEMMKGEEIEVRLDEIRNRPSKKAFFIEIIYEDRDVIVVNKPAGAIIQHGRSRGGERTYVDSLREYLRKKYQGRGSYVVPVHRLDKETSGLMVFAKSREGEKLVEQFKQHLVTRSYLAVVEGAVARENGRIGLPLKKGDFGFGKRAGIGRKGEGKSAITEYVVKERYSNATFLRLDLKTGRTHQARVHMAAEGHPIVGDSVYGKSDGIKFGRHALHSHLLRFKHPATGKKMEFKLPLPGDMEELIDRLRGE